MKNEITTSADQEQVMILDCTAYPRQSLIQNDEGTRAMCTALKDILWFSDFVFPATGAHDKPVKMTVTNVDPDQGGARRVAGLVSRLITMAIAGKIS